MQRTEAAAVLGVDENATAAQARERARQLESELSQKIGRAPTPSLRSSYQRSLQQVAEAARAFTGDGPDAGGADLPASEPQSAAGTGAPADGSGIGVADITDPPRKKSNAGKVAAVAGAVAIAGLATAATIAHGTEAKHEDAADHHTAHEHHDEIEPPPSTGIEDGLLSAVLEELSTVNVDHIAAEAAPSLDSWMVIDDPNPAELAPPEPEHHAENLFDALDAVAHIEQSVEHVSVDISSGDGVDILDLTSGPNIEIASGGGVMGSSERVADLETHHHHDVDDDVV